VKTNAIDPVVTVTPRYVGPPIEPGCDMYGCRRRDVNYGIGVYSECVHHPLAQYNSIEEIEEHYSWPTADWFDYSVIPDQINGKETCPIQGGGSGPFLVYAELRGIEQAYVDLVIDPDLVGLDKLFNFCYDNYPYLAHSKLRTCSIGPELLIGQLPSSVSGRVRILRAGTELWSDSFSTGEANMSHTIANLEHHHFKYQAFRQPGDVHCHFFGTATLSSSAGIVARPGDVFEISAAPFGRPLRNPLIQAEESDCLIAVQTL